jgi:hypothetical protein
MTPAHRLLAASLLGVLALAALAVALAPTGAVVAQGGGALLDRPVPEIVGGPWINGPALAPPALRGRVIFVEFWTYG